MNQWKLSSKNKQNKYITEMKINQIELKWSVLEEWVKRLVNKNNQNELHFMFRLYKYTY